MAPPIAAPRRFWRQRLTAIANVPLTIFLILSLRDAISARAIDDVQAYLARPSSLLPCSRSSLSASLHMRIGLKEIIEDYVHGEGCKVVAIVLATFFAVGVALACAFAIFKISLGA